MISVLIILLIATNIITIYLLNRKEIKKYFAKSFIKSVNLEKVNKIFESEKISENLYGPKKDVIVKSFCVPSGGKDIIGKTSDYEAWILSSLSKISKNIFEFGTCSGKTTTLMALNSPNDSKIITLTLDSNQAKNLSLDKYDNKINVLGVKGPFNYLEANWIFDEYDNGTLISISLELDLENIVLESLIKKESEKLINKAVLSFEKRIFDISNI